MKRTVSIILNILSSIFALWSVISITIFSFGLYYSLIHPNMDDGIKSILPHPLVFSLEIIAFLCLLVGSIGVLKKLKWGLILVRAFFIIDFYGEIYKTFDNLYSGRNYNEYLIVLPFVWIVLDVLLIVFFFLPIVKSLFENQPPIPNLADSMG